MLALRAEGKEKQNAQRTAQARLNALDSDQGQLLSHLQQTDREVAQAWEWLQQNQNLFEKEVFGPPMLTCSVKDPRYKDLVQAFLQRDDFLCFTAQTRQDHKTLSDQLYDVQKLSATIRTCFADVNSFRRPMSQAQLNELGLDGFVLDFLEGPDPVLAMLCSEKNIHKQAIALGDISEEQYDKITMNGNIRSFAAGRECYQIKSRAEYGPGAVSTAVTQVRKGSFWSDKPVDDSVKRELQNQLAEAVGEFQELKKENIRLTGLMDALRAEASKMRDEVVRYSACRYRVQFTDVYNRSKSEARRMNYKRNTAFCKLFPTRLVGFLRPYPAIRLANLTPRIREEVRAGQETGAC